MTKDKIDLNMNLSLDDSLTVAPTDSITTTYSYVNPLTQVAIPVTSTLTNLSGGSKTQISGDADVSAPVLSPDAPSTGKGTGSVDLINGTFKLNLTQGDLAGFVALINNGSSSLSVTFTSGVQQVINNPNSFDLGTLSGSGSTTTTGTTATGSTATGSTAGTTAGSGYQKPVIVQGSDANNRANIQQALGDGEMVGINQLPSGLRQAVYWANPTASETLLSGSSASDSTSAHGIAVYSNQTVIVGSYSVQGSQVQQPCFWTRASGQLAFKFQSVTGFPNGGAFEAINANGSTIVGYSLDVNGRATPMAYISGTPYSLPGDNRSADYGALGVDNNNDILGGGFGGLTLPGVWKNVSVDPNSKTISTPFQRLTSPGGLFDNNIDAFSMSPVNGTIAGGVVSQGQAYYWTAASGFTPSSLSFGSGVGGIAVGVNDAGTELTGAISPSATPQNEDAALWPTLTGSPVDVSSAISSTYTNLTGRAVLNDGSLIAVAVGPSPSYTQTYLYIQKK